MNPKLIFTGIIVVIVALIIGLCWGGLVGKNEATHWQVKQSITGKLSIQDKAGYYFKGFATITPYPRYVSMRWNDIANDGRAAKESIRTTFNDGGTAQISTDIRFATPTSEENRIKFHQQFSGNIENATIAVKSHLTNCIKASGPLMSASENQSARKAEFTQLVEDQTVNGLYAMERIEREIPVVQTDEDIKTHKAQRFETIITTKLVLDDTGMPKIAKVSPLKTYGISVLQFSITETKYDDETLKQFAAKKDSFLAAEQSKADKVKFVQEKLAIEADYAKQIAEEKGKAEMEKMKQITDAERDKELAEIDAAKKVEVALLAKEEAETKAEMKKSVANIEKEAALVVANQKLEVATIEAQAAEQTKLAMIAEAEGKQKAIELSGAITEQEEVLAKIAAQRDVEISANLTKIASPSTVFLGGSDGEGGSANYFNNLLSYTISQNAGLIPTPSNVPAPRVAPVK